jgi:hypothetical protein
MSIPETKICAKCGIEKKADEYTIVKTKRGKYNPHLMSRCKSCKAQDQKRFRKPYDSEYALSWKSKNPDKVKEYQTKVYQNRKQRWENFMKEQKCSRCGISDYRVLQWHHIDPSTKTMTIGAQARIGKWNEVMEEVKKCICVCANCHFILHAEECTSH